MRNIFLLLSLFVLMACSTSTSNRVDVSDINVKTTVERFDQKFYGASQNNLQELKRDFPYLFPVQTPDSIWIEKINNPDERELFDATQQVFENFDEQKIQLESLFKHVKYYYPKFMAPKVVTLISGVDYENNVIYADSLLLVSLDMYLGVDHEVYQGFPKYLRKNYHSKHLIVDVAKKISQQKIPNTTDRTFLGKMIAQGKLLVMLDYLLPDTNDAEKMGYTQEELQWVMDNEIDMWKYFVQNKHLYNTDTKLTLRFLNEAPFSKFYLPTDNESPGRVGVWLGWQIVRSFMKHNNVSLQQMLVIKPDEIFKKSKYKPKK